MSRFASPVALLLLVLSTTGCYHATVETGATPSAVTVRKGFAHGWIYGLVPPSTVETASRCTTGVARVETQLSFVNQLVSFFTWGIYTPMEVEVTCAAAAPVTSSQNNAAQEQAAGATGFVDRDQARDSVASPSRPHRVPRVADREAPTRR